MGISENHDRLYLLGFQNHCRYTMKLKDACSLEEKIMTNLDSILKKQRHHFTNKGPSSQSYGFSSHYVQMWELDYKEYRAQELMLWTVVLEKTLESPSDSKEIKPVNPKGNQPWIFIGRTDAKAEVLALWPPHAKSWLFGRLWCWERLRARGEGDDREWDAWMASVTEWIWVWTNSGR